MVRDDEHASYDRQQGGDREALKHENSHGLKRCKDNIASKSTTVSSVSSRSVYTRRNRRISLMRLTILCILMA